jgi:hypothetical protein
VLVNTTGFVVYIRNDPASTQPWQIYRYDQAGNKTLKVFEGTREIQSVAVSGDGNTVLATMRATTTTGSPFDVFRFAITPKSTTQLTNTTTDENDVSVSANGLMMVWQGVNSGRATIYVRQYTGTTFTQSFLSQSAPQLQPSISGDGGFIALIRQITSNNSYRVLSFKRSDSSYTTVANSTTLLEHPSVSNGAAKVAWLQNAATDTIRVKDIVANTTTNIVSSTAGLEHPFLTATAKHITYSQLVNSNWNVRVRDLVTNTVVASTGTAAPITNKGVYWQDIGFYIEPGIVGEQWAAISKNMMFLPENRRRNVVYFDGSGNIYANRIMLRDTFTGSSLRQAVSVAEPSDPSPSSTGLTAQALPGCVGGTGPYRRIYSKAGVAPGGIASQGSYSFVAAELLLPTRSSIIATRRYLDDPNRTYQETPYIYLGGWANGGKGIQIDAGLQYNVEELEKPDSDPSKVDSWSLFIKRSGGSPDTSPYEYRFKSGQIVYLEFWVPVDDKVVITALGKYTRPPLAGADVGLQDLDLTFVADANGWKANGANNVMKRVTSIAQRGSNDPGNDGFPTTYEESFSSGSRMLNVIWNNVRIGGNRGATAFWNGGQTASVCNYPDDRDGTFIIDVFPDPSTDFPYEEVSISLQ